MIHVQGYELSKAVPTVCISFQHETVMICIRRYCFLIRSLPTFFLQFTSFLSFLLLFFSPNHVQVQYSGHSSVARSFSRFTVLQFILQAFRSP